MICPKCNNQVVDGADFCSNCGNRLVIQSNSQYQQYSFNNNCTNVTKPSEKKKPAILPILSIAVIMILVVFVAYNFINKKIAPSDNQQQDIPIINNDSNSNSIIDDNNYTGTSTIPETSETEYDKDGAFLMPIDDVFTITGEGTIVTGRVMRGKIIPGDEIQIIGLNHEIITTTVSSIEKFRVELDSAEAGDSVAIGLKDVSRTQVERGQVLATPNSIKESKKFEAKVDILSEKEGGRYTPFFNNYRPQFYFRTVDITGVITLPSDVEMVSPGETGISITVELISSVAMEVGTEFSIREDGRAVGKGVVTKVY